MPKILEFFGLNNVFASIKTYWRPAVIVFIAIVIVAGAYLLTKNHTIHIVSLIVGIVLIFLAEMRLRKEFRDSDSHDVKNSEGGK